MRTADVTGSVKLPEGTEMVMPGDTVSLTIDVSWAVSVARFSSLLMPSLCGRPAATSRRHTPIFVRMRGRNLWWFAAAECVC